MPAKRSAAPVLQARFRVLRGSEIALGPGKADLLEHIAATGSIAEAAKQLGMSYMRAWSLVKTMNACFREPLVSASRGGRSRGGAGLTATGQEALRLYRGFESASRAAVAGEWDAFAPLLKP